MSKAGHGLVTSSMLSMLSTSADDIRLPNSQVGDNGSLSDRKTVGILVIFPLCLVIARDTDMESLTVHRSDDPPTDFEGYCCGQSSWTISDQRTRLINQATISANSWSVSVVSSPLGMIETVLGDISSTSSSRIVIGSPVCC